VIDPLSTAAGTAATVLRERIQKYFQSGTIDRLFRLLDKRFGDDTGLTVTQLETWRDDASFQKALFFVGRGDWATHRPGLRRAVLALIAGDRKAPQDHETCLTDEVVEAIEELLPQAKQGDELVRYEGARTRAHIDAVNVRYITLDWVPKRAHQLVQDLVDENPVEGGKLEAALRGDPTTVVGGLVRQPPSWVASGSGRLWAAIAAIAESYGHWKEAQDAWEKAADRPGGDRVRALLRARVAARVLGRQQRADELLDVARQVDPAHPLMLIEDAREEEDPQHRFAALARIETRETRHEAMVRAERAAALTRLERFDEAAEEVRLAKAAVPDFGHAREVGASLTVARYRKKWLAGQGVNREALLEAAEELIASRNEHRELKVYGGSVFFLAAAADAYWLADTPEETARLLDPKELLPEELEVPQARQLLGEAAIRVGHPEYALEILPESEVSDDVDRFIRASAASFVGDRGALDDATDTLDVLVAAGGPLATFAARQRLLVAADRRQEWSDAAEKLVSADDCVLAAIFKARWLISREQFEDAESALLPHAAELRVKHQLVGVARAAGDERKTVVRARAVLAEEADRSLRLECAETLLVLGDEEGVEPLRRLADDAAAPTWIRVRALASLAGRAQASERHGEVLALTEPWLELAPRDRRAGFSRAQALAGRGEFVMANGVLERHELVPARLGETLLAGQIWAMSLPAADAINRIVEAADRLPAPDEDLEWLLVVTAMGKEDLGLSEEVAERTRPDRFIQRFPDSRALALISAEDGDEQSLVATVTELVRARAERATDLERQVFRDGTLPLATLAHAVGKTLGELLFLARRIPLAYGDEGISRAEVDDARRAIGLGAVWDQASLFVVGGLGEDLLPDAHQALPTGIVCQSVLDDCIADRARPQTEGERMDLTFNLVAEDLEMTTWTAADLERDRYRSEGMLTLAQGFDAEPDLVASDAGPEADALRRFEDLSVPLRAYLGTLAVARRLDLPIFSDDRCVRLRAREAGLRAFGSLALLEALVGREQIDPSDRARVRTRLRHVGGLGTAPSAEEMLEEARRAEWGLTRSVAHVLLDRQTVFYRSAEGMRMHLELLRAAHREAPERFPAWVGRSLDGLRTSLPHLSIAVYARFLLLLAWEPWEVGGEEFLGALIAALRQQARPLGTLGDLVVDTTELLMAIIRESDLHPAAEIAMRRHAIEQLPQAERSRARLAAFLQRRSNFPQTGRVDFEGPISHPYR